MAELNIFHYLPQNSLIHRLDGRIKLLCMLFFSLTISFSYEIIDLFILSALLSFILIGSKLPILKLLSEVRYFLALIGFILVVQAFGFPGTPIKWLPIPGITIEGLSSGIIFGWKLILIVIICLILTGTTTLSTIRNVIEWFLRPVPFIPEARVGTMFSLTFVLIPLVFDEASQIMDAQKSRCVENRKNPLKRIILLVYPLLLQAFLRADEMTQAMEARCYTENRTKPVFKANYLDWFLLLFFIAICLMIWFL